MNINRLEDFKSFVEKEIQPAAKDLTKLDDRSRKHVQRLVYTNVVDRFDSMIDSAILNNCREEVLVEDATKKLTQPITEAEFLKLLLQSDGLQDALEEKLKSALREIILRERHSRKLAKLFSVFKPEEECWNLPRVQIATGKIYAKVSVQGKTTPHSICGFSDWLYSRHNSVVHGAGRTSLLDNDRKQLEKMFRVKPAQRIRLQLSSVNTAATFYLAVVNILME